MEDIRAKGDIAYHLDYLENYCIFITLYLSNGYITNIILQSVLCNSFSIFFYFLNKNINNKILNINTATSERSLNIEL